MSADAMLKGPALKSVIIFALPIILGNAFQQFYSMVDSIVVGKYEGANALAAVGSASTVSNCLVMACSGFTAGASVVVSQLYGAGQFKDIKTTISTTLIFSITLAVAVSIIFVPLVPGIAVLTHVPEDIMDGAVTYMRIYGAGLIFLMLYNFFAAVLRSLGDSVTPLIFLIISSLLNIVGDLYFVIELKMGVAGVAWATVLSQAVSVFLCIIHVFRKSDYFRFGKGEFTFSKRLFRYVMRLGIPSAVQSTVTNMGFVFVQGLVNRFSTVNIAAYTAAMKMEGLSMVPFGGVAQAYAVFAGQNIGAGNVDRTKKGLKQCLIFISAMALTCSAVIYVVGPLLISLFVDSGETVVIERGTAYLRVYCPFLVVHGVMAIYVSMLRGVGDSFHAMLISLSDLMSRVLAAYALSLWAGFDFMGCAYAVPIGWAVASVLALYRYHSGKWMGKAVTEQEA